MQLQLQIKREYFHDAREALLKLTEIALFGTGGEITFAAVGGDIVVRAGPAAAVGERKRRSR